MLSVYRTGLIQLLQQHQVGLENQEDQEVDSRKS